MPKIDREIPIMFRIPKSKPRLKIAFTKAAKKMQRKTGSAKGHADVIIPALEMYLLGEDENGAFVVKK
jgi:hypothetical protein